MSSWFGSGGGGRAASTAGFGRGGGGGSGYEEEDQAAMSVPWIRSEERSGTRRLRLSDTRTVFANVQNDPTNLISIFGKARQGKSFLMNCLSGEREVFRVSNAKESCTTGIDISSKWLSLQEFSTVDGGNACACSNIKVGFVDAEGQGDKDVTYDAKLVCPILLASKAVIFNWKDGMQKDAMLNMLGIMTKAAENVRKEEGGGGGGGRGGSSPPFGHLHIVFRDWNSMGSTPEEVKHELFTEERVLGSETRNVIRRDLIRSFESVSVHLFDPPTVKVADMKKKLTVDMTSESFRDQVRSLRKLLTAQLRTETRYGNMILTGKKMRPIMASITDTLNEDGVVLPMSAYVTMMRSEVDQLRTQTDTAMQAAMEEVLVDVDFVTSEGGKRSSSSSSSSSSRARAFTSMPTQLEAQQVLARKLTELTQEFTRSADAAMGEGDADANTKRDVLRDTPNVLRQRADQVGAHFAAEFKIRFRTWLDACERKALVELDNVMAELTAPQTQVLAEDVFARTAVQQWGIASCSVMPAQKHNDGEGVKEMQARVTRQFEQKLAEAQRYLSSRRGKDLATLRGIKDRYMGEIEAAIQKEIKQLTARNTPREAGAICTGYPETELVENLNNLWHTLNETLQEEARGSQFKAQIEAEFMASCQELNTNNQKAYKRAKDEAVHLALNKCSQALPRQLQSMLPKLVSDPAYLKNYEVQLEQALKHLRTSTVSECTSWVHKWTLDENDKKGLRDNIVQQINTYGERQRQQVHADCDKVAKAKKAAQVEEDRLIAAQYAEKYAKEQKKWEEDQRREVERVKREQAIREEQEIRYQAEQDARRKEIERQEKEFIRMQQQRQEQAEQRRQEELERQEKIERDKLQESNGGKKITKKDMLEAQRLAKEYMEQMGGSPVALTVVAKNPFQVSHFLTETKKAQDYMKELLERDRIQREARAPKRVGSDRKPKTKREATPPLDDDDDMAVAEEEEDEEEEAPPKKAPRRSSGGGGGGGGRGRSSLSSSSPAAAVEDVLAIAKREAKEKIARQIAEKAAQVLQKGGKGKKK